MDTFDRRAGFDALLGGMSIARRVSLGVAAGLLMLLAVAAAVWVMQPDYKVLFSNLSEPDAAVIVAQLKRSKTDYRLTDGGTTVRVPADRVYETRLALVAAGAPLSAGVGFEIFDKQGLGATEQSQRVSYQRALQGELARTIGAIDHVRQARVLIAMSEPSLFRRDQQQPRAAVSLVMQPGPPLDREQVSGIQRLVAASVASLDPARVIVTDQRGITLSGADSLEGPSGVGGNRLAMKREIEEYFTRKVADLLERAYGRGQVLVSVDVALNFDEVRRTVQDILPASPNGSGQDTGVRRRHEVVSGSNSAESNLVPTVDAPAANQTTKSTEVEYEYGRRVEQFIAAPGNIQQINVGIIVRNNLSADQQARVAQLVKMAAGLNERRGDGVSVQAVDTLDAHAYDSAASSSLPSDNSEIGIVSPAMAAPAGARVPLAAGLVGCCVVLIALLLLAAFLRGRRVSRKLNPEERRRLLEELSRALATPPKQRAPS